MPSTELRTTSPTNLEYYFTKDFATKLDELQSKVDNAGKSTFTELAKDITQLKKIESDFSQAYTRVADDNLPLMTKLFFVITHPLVYLSSHAQHERIHGLITKAEAQEAQLLEETAIALKALANDPRSTTNQEAICERCKREGNLDILLTSTSSDPHFLQAKRRIIAEVGPTLKPPEYYSETLEADGSSLFQKIEINYVFFEESKVFRDFYNCLFTAGEEDISGKISAVLSFPGKNRIEATNEMLSGLSYLKNARCWETIRKTNWQKVFGWPMALADKNHSWQLVPLERDPSSPAQSHPIPLKVNWSVPELQAYIKGQTSVHFRRPLFAKEQADFKRLDRLINPKPKEERQEKPVDLGSLIKELQLDPEKAPLEALDKLAQIDPKELQNLTTSEGAEKQLTSLAELLLRSLFHAKGSYEIDERTSVESLSKDERLPDEYKACIKLLAIIGQMPELNLDLDKVFGKNPSGERLLDDERLTLTALLLPNITHLRLNKNTGKNYVYTTSPEYDLALNDILPKFKKLKSLIVDHVPNPFPLKNLPQTLETLELLSSTCLIDKETTVLDELKKFTNLRDLSISNGHIRQLNSHPRRIQRSDIPSKIKRFSIEYG